MIEPRIFVAGNDRGTVIRICDRDRAEYHYHLARSFGGGPDPLRIGIGPLDAIAGVKRSWPAPVTVVHDDEATSPCS